MSTMQIILENYVDLIAKNWIEPAIKNCAVYIETKTSTNVSYRDSCANKYYYLASLHNNDKYEIRLNVARDGSSCIILTKFNLADLLEGKYSNESSPNPFNEATLATRISFRCERDILDATQKLESLLPAKTTEQKETK
jgi:hypothetical protein